MSASADSGPGADALARLEALVARAAARIREVEASQAEAERRVDELDRILSGITSDQVRPSALLERVHALEAENAELRRRIAGGREGVERLLAKIRFLEEQR